MALLGGMVKSRKDMSSSEVFDKIAGRAGVEEGKRAVERVFTAIAKNAPASTRNLVGIVNLPTPVIAHIRKELEKEGLILRQDDGAILSPEGTKLLEEMPGKISSSRFRCASCGGKTVALSEPLKSFVYRLEEFQKSRPKPDNTLDQFYATSETSCLRAALMQENGDVDGKDIVFFGDDDLTSVCVASLKSASSVTVIDIDDRILGLVSRIAVREGLSVKTVQQDFRAPWAQGQPKADVASMDPPYTIDGLKLFLSAASGIADTVYLSFSHKPPSELRAVEDLILSLGFCISAMIPQFNKYQSSGTFGGQTFIMRLVKTKAKAGEGAPVKDGVYTGQATPVVRHYRCMECGKVFLVGPGKEFATVNALKEKGCECGKKKFGLVRREKIRE